MSIILPQIPAQTIPRSFDEWIMVLPSGPTIPLPPVAGQKLIAAPIIAGLLPATIPAAPFQTVDTVSPTTGEIARLPALVLTDPRLADLDPVTWSRAADMLRPYFTQVVDFLTDQRDHSKLAGDGAHLLVGLKRIKAGQPDPAPRARAERVIRDAISPAQASRAESHRQSVLAFARLLVEWGICPDMPTLRDPVYAPDPWKYEASIVCPGGIVVNRRGPGVHHYLKGRCATSRAELEACKVELDQDYLRAEAAMHKRQDFIRQPAERIFVTQTGQSAPISAADQIDAEIAQLQQAAFKRGVTTYAEQRAAR
jgi:hypothetical protein